MVATASTMRELGSQMPAFEITALDGEKRYNNSALNSQPVLLMFICNHCPFVVHIAEKMALLAKQLQEQGMSVIAISSNDVENYPQDSPALMVEFATRYGFDFPYCYDETQGVAKAFAAACTPDFFIYDRNHALRYRGQFDASRPGNHIEVNGEDLFSAACAILNDESPSEHQVPSIGCNIKWK